LPYEFRAGTPVEERSKLLYRLADIIEERMDEFVAGALNTGDSLAV
jgi:acyl-CoA reductase-like NAD-dependent aldehyde dehydrogenase